MSIYLFLIWACQISDVQISWEQKTVFALTCILKWVIPLKSWFHLTLLNTWTAVRSSVAWLTLIDVLNGRVTNVFSCSLQYLSLANIPGLGIWWDHKHLCWIKCLLLPPPSLWAHSQNLVFESFSWKKMQALHKL